MKTSLGIWAFGPMATRFVPGGYQPRWIGEPMDPYTEDAVAAVRRSVLQWRFIDSVSARIDGAALREEQAAKDAVRAYDLVYAARGA